MAEICIQKVVTLNEIGTIAKWTSKINSGSNHSEYFTHGPVPILSSPLGISYSSLSKTFQ